RSGGGGDVPGRAAGSRGAPAPRPPSPAPRPAPRRSGRSRRGAPRRTPPARGPLRSRRAPARGRRAPTARRSRLELALLRGRKQHVVEDQAVARRMRVERQVGRRVPDLVLLIFRIVPAEERPRPLAVVAMDVLDPGRPFLVSQHQVALLQPFATAAAMSTRSAASARSRVSVAVHMANRNPPFSTKSRIFRATAFFRSGTVSKPSRRPRRR